MATVEEHHVWYLGQLALVGYSDLLDLALRHTRATHACITLFLPGHYSPLQAFGILHRGIVHADGRGVGRITTYYPGVDFNLPQIFDLLFPAAAHDRLQGNAVELIFSILALVKCELRVVQSSLIGSILSNLLLVLGFCFFVGGTRFSEQGFVSSASQLNSSLLTLSVIGVLIPAAFDMVAGNGRISGFDNETEQRDILKLSRVTAVVLLFTYFSYLYFQLFSHKALYNDKIGSKPETVQYPPRDEPGVTSPVKDTAKKLFPLRSRKDDAERQAEDGEEEKTPKLSMLTAVTVLVVVTVLIAVTALWLVDSIDGLVSGGKISKGFVGLILVPIVDSIATLTAAVADSMKDKLTSSLGAAAGSSIQIALFIIPFTIILGWIIGRPITMLFDPFESIVLFLTILTVNYVVQDGKSNWLEGMILICLYVIVATVFWFYPGTEPTGILTCPA